jgi:hypothetical protein
MRFFSFSAAQCPLDRESLTFGDFTQTGVGRSSNGHSDLAWPLLALDQSLLDMGNQPLTPRVRKAPGTTSKFRPSPRVSQARTYGYGNHCLLWNRASFEPIPIEQVDVEVNIVHSLAEVTVKQRYRNDTASPIECTCVKDDFAVGARFAQDFKPGFLRFLCYFLPQISLQTNAFDQI